MHIKDFIMCSLELSYWWQNFYFELSINTWFDMETFQRFKTDIPFSQQINKTATFWQKYT